MKIRHFNIMRLLYCLVLALPFVAILSRVIYVQSNKNAYQSYYGETINEVKIINVNNNNQMEINQEYKFTGESGIQVVNDNNARIYYQNAKNIYVNPNNTNIIENVKKCSYFRCTYYGTNNYIVFYDSDNTETQVVSLITYEFSFDFTLIQYDNNNRPLSEILNGYLTKYEYNNYSYLDNVFEYSVNKFIDDNNFGRINLFQWTTNLFFDDNQVNNMYVHFVNWYLNYVLLMSTTYILFLVLMWFVNYSRRLLERGMNYDW